MYLVSRLTYQEYILKVNIENTSKTVPAAGTSFHGKEYEVGSICLCKHLSQNDSKVVNA